MTDFELRPIEIHEINAFASCQAAAFGGRYTPDKLESLAEELRLDRSLAFFDSGDLVATTSSYVVPMTLPGLVRCKVAAVTDVSVAPTHRRRGMLTSMMRRQLDDLLLGDRADDDRVDVAGEHAGRVLERLAASQVAVGGGQADAGAAELTDPDLEGDPRPGRGLVEDQRQRAAGQQLMRLTPGQRGFQLVRQVESRGQLFRFPVRNAEEMPPFQSRCGESQHRERRSLAIGRLDNTRLRFYYPRPIKD